MSEAVAAPPETRPAAVAEAAIRSAFEGYQGGKEMPLGGFAAILGLFNVAVAGFVWAIRRTGRELPERISLPDLLLLGVATHKLSRLITKDWVTSPIRAPFTEYQGTAEGGEVKEKARGEGLQLALGDLFT